MEDKHLTPREQEVNDLIAKGWNNARIGKALGINPGTVKVYVRGIIRKSNGVSPRFLQDKLKTIIRLKSSIEEMTTRLAQVEREYEMYKSLHEIEQSVTL